MKTKLLCAIALSSLCLSPLSFANDKVDNVYNAKHTKKYVKEKLLEHGSALSIEALSGMGHVNHNSSQIKQVLLQVWKMGFIPSVHQITRQQQPL